MTQLVVCLECSRHVRVTDPTCPFCGGTARERRRAVLRVAGIGRAAIMALGATVAGCGSGDPPAAAPVASEPAGETIAPSERLEAAPPGDPSELVEPAPPAEPPHPIEAAPPSEPVDTAPPPEPEPEPRSHRRRAVPRDTIGAPAPAYGAAPLPREPAMRRSPPDDDNGGNVPLYGGPGLES